MGQTKRALERREEREAAAAEIAGRAGLLEECACHGDWVAVRPPDDGEVEALAADLLRRGDPVMESFAGNLAEVASAIHDLVGEYRTGCPICASNAAPEKDRFWSGVADKAAWPEPGRAAEERLARPAAEGIDPAEAALLVQVARAWQAGGRPGAADTVRRVYADWLADRSRPEEYVVRHYEPQLWVILRAVDGGPDGMGQTTEYRLPWLPVAVRSDGWVTDPQRFAALLVANGARADPSLPRPRSWAPHPVDG